MKNCPNLQKSLDWCEGTPQYPGIRRRLYYINKNLIEIWPTLERDEFGRVIDAHYLGAFTIAADAAWQYIDINIDKSMRLPLPLATSTTLIVFSSMRT